MAGISILEKSAGHQTGAASLLAAGFMAIRGRRVQVAACVTNAPWTAPSAATCACWPALRG